MSTVIKQILATKQMSQSRLSQLARIPQPNMNLIVNGKQTPGPAWRARISEALECPEEFLFPEVNQNATGSNENG